MIEPKPVSGLGPESAWLNRIREYVRSFRLLPGPGYRLNQTPAGIVLDIDNKRGAPKAGLTLSQYLFQSHNAGVGTLADYISCKPAGGGANINILKPWLLRFSIASRNVQGQLITYTNYDPVGQSRQAANAFTSVTQFITPQYVIGDVIWALSVSYLPAAGPPAQTTLLDINVDGRVFAGP